MTEQSSEAKAGRGGRQSEKKFAEHPNAIGANMTPEMRRLANYNRRMYDAYAASMESWYRSGCQSLPNSDEGPAFLTKEDDDGS